MSLTWESKVDRELEERYSEWRERQVMEQLNDYGIEFMPEDKSYRDYKPGMYQTPKDATTHLLLAFGISGVILAAFIIGVNYVSKVVAR